ncbi:hypothetical protein DPMN_112862 [Dreissena polymorpha]|uniref:Uncharacterized protein n=1 Tax=Dreissena polymorpha TaxID=45954 RepID=A0A9D4QR17_DREPO|nr:hypothetical protein DPMN_112862 [Dreissena polymorpha]
MRQVCSQQPWKVTCLVNSLGASRVWSTTLVRHVCSHQPVCVKRVVNSLGASSVSSTALVRHVCSQDLGESRV